MEVAVVVSKKDIAGLNIKEQLLKEGFDKTDDRFENNEVFELTIKGKKIGLYTTEEESVYCENIDKRIKADLFLFATKHQSAAKINSFTVHPIGNFGRAEFGGKEKELCKAPSFYLKTAFQLLTEFNELKHEVIQEATHHGPYMESPVMFIEIGSSPEEWRNQKGGRILAKSILELLSSKERHYKTAFGIGGMHHTPNFKKIILNSEIALSHLCPKYNLQNLDEEMVLQAIQKSIPKAEIALLDWKGLGTEKERIKELLSTIQIETIKLKDAVDS